jgi:LuxR family maltose regulon positive regulatory protein
MTDLSPILLQTKLHRPQIVRDVITRQRLIEHLNRGIRCPLIVINAPAGFGKTTLVCHWLEQSGASQGERATSSPTVSWPVAWLSLDQNDSDLNLFMRYFIAALRTIFEEACAETQTLLNSRQQAPPEVLNATFSNELQALPGEAIFVLDDYQFIRGQEVHNLLNGLARHWPKPLHLVLISRVSPPFALSSLRAKGMLTEIRTQDLRFTKQETTAYLNQAQLTAMGHSALQVLDERFEGWPAGLHLAALSLRSADSQNAVLLTLSSNNPDIAGYLIDEVLTHQLPAIHTFLLKSSILDRFCASLCDSVFGEIDSEWSAQACLDWIERSELFIIPLDDHQEWYRYHHLFQELLQIRLSAEMPPEEVAEMHHRASLWFEAQGLRDEALQHALAAGDFDLTSRQMYGGLRDALNREDRPTLERWLHLLPEEMIEQRPELLMIRVWVLQFQWRLDQQAQVLQQVEALLDAGAGESLPASELQILRRLALPVRAQQAYFNNQLPQAIDLCQQVLTLFPPSWIFVRGGAMLYLGMALHARGQTQDAEQLLLSEYESYGDRVDLYSLFLLQSLCFNYLNAGQLEQTLRTADLLIQRATRGGLALMKHWGHWFLGMVCWHRNELEEAAKHFRQIVENRYVAQISAYRDAVAGLALIRQTQGEPAAAWQLLESISQFDLRQKASEDSRTRALRARLLLMQGDLDGASRWAETFLGPPSDHPLIWLEEPQVTRACILLIRGKEDDLQSALRVLDSLEDIADRTHNTRYKIEILALRAMALQATGENKRATVELKQAVKLAQSGSFVRVFVDLGQPIQEMLRRLAHQKHFAEPIQPILAAFPEHEKSTGGHDDSIRHAALVNSTLPEPLTPRELEVLTLLEEPSSIREIALTLNITYATARRHTINVYGKLGVNKRWDAVARAIELGILSS